MHRLSLQTLSKSYDGRKVVDAVSMEVKSGEVVGLLGPNGAGKTSTFFMVLGLLQPDAGKIYLDGEDISHLPIYRRARLGLQYLPQEPSVFRKLTVAENIMAILETLEPDAKVRQERQEKLLADLRISHLAHQQASALSGGERRRVEICRQSENCLPPSEIGPDYDFGASPILRTLPNGRRILVAGQKSGMVWGHDPDRDGTVVWKAQLVKKLALGMITFGGAADDQNAYFGCGQAAWPRSKWTRANKSGSPRSLQHRARARRAKQRPSRQSQEPFFREDGTACCARSRPRTGIYSGNIT